MSLGKYFLALVVLNHFLMFVALKIVFVARVYLVALKMIFGVCPFESVLYLFPLYKFHVAGRLENDVLTFVSAEIFF